MEEAWIMSCSSWTVEHIMYMSSIVVLERPCGQVSLDPLLETLNVQFGGRARRNKNAGVLCGGLRSTAAQSVLSAS
eukprot:5113415-Amphidinium_carterae.2